MDDEQSEGGDDPVRLVHRRAAVVARPWFDRGDAFTSLSLVALLPIAWLCPPAAWPRISRALGAMRRVSPDAPDAIRTRGSTGSVCAQAAVRELDANRRELRLQVLRELAPWGWHPAIDLRGREHLERALAQQRGAVLWVSHFVFAGLVAKIALRRVGVSLAHLSRPEHGFSKTRFGIAVLNPIRCRAEDRYLGERVSIGAGGASAAMRELRAVLARNGVVSVTVGDWEGFRFADVPFADGRIRIGTGAAKLAWLTGAALLPVHVVRRGLGDAFEVVIGAPLLPREAAGREQAIEAAVAAYARGLQPVVMRHPGQWRGWSGVRAR